MEQGKQFKRKIGERGQVTIPKEIRVQFGLRSGEEVIFTVDEDGVIQLRNADNDEELAAAYQRTAERDRELNAEWEHVSTEATAEVEYSDADQRPITRKELTEIQDRMGEALQEEVDADKEWDEDSPVSVRWRAIKLCDELGLSEEVRFQANLIIKMMYDKDRLTGNSVEPAATVYLASRMYNEEKTLEEVADAAGIPSDSLHTGYRTLCEFLDIDNQD